MYYFVSILNNSINRISTNQHIFANVNLIKSLNF